MENHGVLKKTNLYFGLGLLLVFLLSGYYMKEYFKPAHLDDFEMRLQIRSNHIYILFVSLLNIISFRCNLTLNTGFSKYLDRLFRILLITSGIVALFAFWNEHTGDLTKRSLTLTTVVLSLASIVVVLLNEALGFFKNTKDGRS